MFSSIYFNLVHFKSLTYSDALNYVGGHKRSLYIATYIAMSKTLTN